MTQSSLFSAPGPVMVGNGVVVCSLCTASYVPLEGDDDTWPQRWADWHAALPHTISSGGLMLVSRR